ncbi:PCMD domain-containing protein [Saccharicrinis aurantiacus]|uniref:PCMD domain-containing protein n=1 Tax=Saccharicrinis aurantiacus TaxID=1849719 RepID=UPI00249304BE|nr:PCMD domain-containing protein [Saccharicrinis aurantiacus]
MRSIFFIITLALVSIANGQVKRDFVNDGQIKYSNMDSWWSRIVSESFLIGGADVHYFEPGPNDAKYQKLENTIDDYTPWSTSNVRAEVGVAAANQSVFQEKRGDGYCVRMETNLKKVVVLGVVNVKAIASGSMFLGDMVDPITETKNPRQNTLMGIPFTEKPKALNFDYKVNVGKDRLKATGGFKVEKVKGADEAEAYVLLQNRTEDSEGNLIVKRVGTAWKKFKDSSNGWVNNFSMPIAYGDITKQANYKSYMGLISSKDPYYALNSKGEKKKYTETAWANADDEVTHIIILFSASYDGGSFIGSPDSKLWIDNIKLEYAEEE